MKYIQPYDQPSTPTAPYVDLNAAIGQDGSIPPADFFNNIQAEILHVITQAGLTPADGDLTQLYQAIVALMPAPVGGPSDAALVHYGTDAGVANALVVTPSPAAAAVSAGFTVFFVPANNSAGPATLRINLSGGGNEIKNLLRDDASALASGDVVANVLCVAVYDGAQFRLARTRVHLSRMVIASSTVISVPAGKTRARAKVKGAGGGGGGSPNVVGSAGAGGGGGEYREGLISGLTPGQQIVCTIGAGGLGGAGGGGSNNGQNGGATSFGGYITANGGGGGLGALAGGGIALTGGAGGSGGTGGDLALAGMSGGYAIVLSSSGVMAAQGGSAYETGQPHFGASDGTYMGGSNGLFPGQGGNGGVGGGPGGQSANGLIIVEFYP